MSMLQEIWLFIEQNKLFLLEILGAILTLWCVYLAAKNNIANWPISMIASVVYFFVFYINHFFSEAYLQIIFLIVQSYGWYYWSSFNKNKTEKTISHIQFRTLFIITIITAIAYFIWYNVYININLNARTPAIDALCTILSLSALFMQAKHWIENWLIWILVDLIYVPMYINGDQWVTAILYFLLIILAIKGYYDWKKDLDK